MEDKKKKIFIISGIASFVLIVLFAFLILNHDRNEAKNESDNLTGETTNDEKLESEEVNPDKEKETEEIVEQTNEQISSTSSPFEEVIFNGNKIKVESNDIQVDSEGNVLFSSNFIQEKLNMPVSWEKGIVYIGEQPIEGTNETGTYLSDKEYLSFRTEENMDLGNSKISINTWEDELPFSIGTNTYSKGIGMNLEYPNYRGSRNPISFYVDYNLAGEYKTFKADIGIDDQYKNENSTYIVRIYGDDKQLYESNPIRGGEFAIPLEVDVTGVIKLTIELDKQDENREETVKAVIGNPILE